MGYAILYSKKKTSLTVYGLGANGISYRKKREYVSRFLCEILPTVLLINSDNQLKSNEA